MIKIPAKSISYGGKRDRSDVFYIVIHYTAGKGDTAQNEGNYFKSVNTRSAGAHFFIGQDGTVVKSIDLNRIAWAVGGSKYADCPQTGGGKFYGKITNGNSVSIELCDNLTRDPSTAQINGVKKCIKYIRKYCKNAKTIVRHFDVTGKHCPARMMDGNRWQSFLSAIGETITTPASLSDFKVKILAKDLNVRKGAGVQYDVVGSVHVGEVYTIIKTQGRWGKLKSGVGWINYTDPYARRV